MFFIGFIIGMISGGIIGTINMIILQVNKELNEK